MASTGSKRARAGEEDPRTNGSLQSSLSDILFSLDETLTMIDDASSSDEDIGPILPSEGPPKKKRRTLAHESLYVAALPCSTRYAKSLMHKDQLAFVTVVPQSDFLITASVDGQVSFWKVGGAEQVEFVKEFKAHAGEIKDVACSWDGRNFASCGADKTVKIWDVGTFDLISVLQLEQIPSCICWVHGRSGGGVPLLAMGNEINGEIVVYDGRGEARDPSFVVKNVHRRPLACMAYNSHWNCVVSADQGGMVEYWVPSESAEKPSGVFEVKSKTGLFDFRKSKAVATSITISPNGRQFATFSFPDRLVRVFDFASGKLYRSYDESLSTATEMQQAGTAFAHLDNAEFNRRSAAERELQDPIMQKRVNVTFDETGHFILFGSILGTKVINTLTNRIVKLYGKDEKLRAVNLALYQGQPEKKSVVTVAMGASDNPLLQEAEAREAILVATGIGKVRFYLFSNDEDISKATRDVQNEKPRQLGAGGQSLDGKQTESGSSATIHTTYGDIHIRLFPSAAPKAVENFVTHSKRGFYNNIIFHRIIRKFMIQTGDPLGDGTGGESIWGKEFEDEFSTLKHDKPYTVSMANAGPNTNGSQFFITTERTPWLDGKHTIFGRAVQGLDVIHRIESTRVIKEKPEEDIKIVDISID
ncbi:MAG: hypothetical protein M1828_000039 [Chrysothrix sp. TS-e1954]|nr:MAG: hypothetical protein M1828_000039 [Chrysothrix sp. TS-e1954]